MPDWMKKYLLSSAAMYAPPGEGDGGEPETENGEAGSEDETVSEDEGSTEEGEGGDAEPEGEEEGEDEGEVDPEPARKPNRAQSRIQTLTQTLAQEKAERQRIDRELQEIKAAQRQREQQSQQESPEARAARRALMSETELLREDMQESEKRTRAMLQQQAVMAQESNDKATYSSILRDAPHLKKYDAEVERVRKENQANGAFVPREVILDYVIGRTARQNAAKQVPKAKAKGQERIAQQRSQPARSAGDTGTQRGRQGDSVEKRLENVPI